MFKRHHSKGFTLIELLVSVGIFAFMTALIVAKYGNFNQNVLLTNLAYDVALAVRTAQTYGLSVKNTGTETGSSPFQYAYGVHFSSVANQNKEFVIFSDLSGNDAYDGDTSGELVSKYAIKRGAVVSGVCASSGNNCSTQAGTVLRIMFRRPDPEAVICIASSCVFTYAKIELKSPDGNMRTVTVRKTGQVTVED